MATEYQLPREAQEQADLAEQLHATLFPQGTPPTEAPTDAVVEPTLNTAPTATEEPVVVPPTEIPQVDEEEERYRDRYMSLKGKYDAEVPRLASELRELRNELTQFKTTPKQDLPPVDNTTDDRIEKLRTEYGDDFIEDWKALIAKEIKSAIEPIKQQTQIVEESQAQVAQREFITALNQASPTGWENLWESHVQAKNGLAPQDPAFTAFLSKQDPNGFYTYGEILDQANLNWDANKMAKVYKLYVDSKTPQVQPVTQQTLQPTAPITPAQEAMVAPARTTTQPTPVTDDSIIWTSTMINDFKRDDRLGKYSKEDSDALWDDLVLAPSQGRIR